MKAVRTKCAAKTAYVMDLSAISEGMIVRNYKEMCSLLKEDIKAGRSKQLQLKEWERYFLWERNGQKYNIVDLFDLPQPKQDNRGKWKHQIKKFDSFLVPEQYMNSPGCYVIYKDNIKYIGSTFDLRRRFLEHYHNYNNMFQKTHDLLMNGGYFDAIKIYQLGVSEKKIRGDEELYIKEYNRWCFLLNTKYETHCLNNKK